MAVRAVYKIVTIERTRRPVRGTPEEMSNNMLDLIMDGLGYPDPDEIEIEVTLLEGPDDIEENSPADPGGASSGGVG